MIAGHTPPGSMETDYIGTVKGAPETLKTMVSESKHKLILCLSFRDILIEHIAYKSCPYSCGHFGIKLCSSLRVLKFCVWGDH